MQDSSNTHNRVVMVINFLATHPTESFTLTELAEKLDISAGTAHRILKTLTEAKYLARHPKHKTYSLGLAMAAIGQAALERHSYVEVAHREMEVLAKELNLQCIAISVVEDEILTVARTGRPQTAESITHVGERRPFSPPFGLVSVAWSSGQKQQSYIERSAWQKSDPRYEYLMHSIELVRNRGFSIAAIGPTLRKIHDASLAYEENPFNKELRLQAIELMGELSNDELQLVEIPRAEGVRISHISAPVFDPNGEVALEIVLTGGMKVLSPDEISHYRSRLCAVAEYITSETHGRAGYPVKRLGRASNL